MTISFTAVATNVVRLEQQLAAVTAERDQLKERLAQLSHDVLAAWRAARPKPPAPKRCRAKSFTLGRCDQRGDHPGPHSVKGEGFGLRIS